MTYVPARRGRGYAAPLGDAAQQEFGLAIESPTLIQTFPVADLPAFPIAIEVHSKSFASSSSSGTVVAVGWDNGSVWEGPPLELTMGGILTITVDSVKGDVLEVWAKAEGGLFPGHDDSGQIDTVIALPLNQAQQRQNDRAPNENAGTGIPSWVPPVGLGLLAIFVLGPIVAPIIAARPRSNPRRHYGRR